MITVARRLYKEVREQDNVRRTYASIVMVAECMEGARRRLGAGKVHRDGQNSDASPSVEARDRRGREGSRVALNVVAPAFAGLGLGRCGPRARVAG